MKKINLLIIFVLAVTIGFISSCKKDPIDYAAPLVTFTNNSGAQEVDSNTAVTIVGTVYAPAELDKIQYFKDDASFGDAITSGFDTDTTHIFTVVIEAALVTETFTFEVQATDKDGKVGKKTATITVNPPVTHGPVDKKSNLQIYCALGDQTGNGDYASLTPNFGTWNHNQAENYPDTIALIDVCYYNGDYTKEIGGDPHFVSPHACPSIIHSGVILTGAKTTKFKILDDVTAFSDWANINNDEAIAAITGITETNVTDTDFAAGDIVAFELADGKKGVMKLIDGTSGSGGSDYIIVDVIVQQNAPAK